MIICMLAVRRRFVDVEWEELATGMTERIRKRSTLLTIAEGGL